MMRFEICSAQDCTGCSACANACIQKCISMQSDSEGFLRPVINSVICINCGRCKKVCPINHISFDDGIEPKAYAVRNRDFSVRLMSSSGGAFSAFADNVWQNKGIVIAVGFDDYHRAVHKMCFDRTFLKDICGSKYVQSIVGTVYQDAEKMLKNGKTVLFCGTPCQIAGLRSYLGRDYTNLFTLDFICHGVPSPLAWNKYLSYREEMMSSKVKSVSFRNKDTGWCQYSMKMTFSNDEIRSWKVTEDPYLRSFIMNMDLRPSCYNCHFKQIHRCSDITMADFWGIDNLKPEWNDDTGVSLILIHTKQGEVLFDLCNESIEKEPVEFRKAILCNPSMIYSSNKPGLRNAFFKGLKNNSFERVHNKFCGKTLTSRFRRKISNLLK